MVLHENTKRAFGWQLIARASDRGLRFASSLILARVLSPDDFGLLAATLVVVAAVEAVSFLGIEQAIVQSPRAGDSRFLGTAFRAMATRGILIASLVYLSAPLIAWYFENEPLVRMVEVAACSSLLVGLYNPWIHGARNALRFMPYSVATIGGAIAQVIASLGFSLAGYGAISLIIGFVANSALSVLASWLLIPRRISFEKDPAATYELRQYAVKAAGVPVIIMLANEAPTLILGRIAGLPLLGLYTLSERLCSLSKEIALPVFGSVLVPAYATIRNDQDALRSVWLRMLGAIAQLTVPITAAMIALDARIPLLFYGNRYIVPSALVAILAVNAAVSALAACCGPMFWALGRPDIDRKALLCRLVALGMLAPLGALYFGVQGFALGVCLAQFAGFAYGVRHATFFTAASINQVIKTLLPAVATCIALSVLYFLLIKLLAAFEISSGIITALIIAFSVLHMAVFGLHLRRTSMV